METVVVTSWPGRRSEAIGVEFVLKRCSSVDPSISIDSGLSHCASVEGETGNHPISQNGALGRAAADTNPGAIRRRHLVPWTPHIICLVEDSTRADGRCDRRRRGECGDLVHIINIKGPLQSCIKKEDTHLINFQCQKTLLKA